MKNYSNKGFSLAEVLVTLTLLGVIASIVIPGLVTRQHSRTTVAKLKKAYELIDNAIGLAIVDNGRIGEEWVSQHTGANTVILSKIEPYLKVAANCITSNSASTGPCNSKISNIPAVLLKDGVSFSLPSIIDTTCSANNGSYSGSGSGSGSSSVSGSGSVVSICGTGLIDVNGTKAPNEYGSDIFVFYVTESGIEPYGMNNDSSNSTYKSAFSTNCMNATGDNRTGCAGWVIYNENLDYLDNCGTLSWSGSHKCN